MSKKKVLLLYIKEYSVNNFHWNIEWQFERHWERFLQSDVKNYVNGVHVYSWINYLLKDMFKLSFKPTHPLYIYQWEIGNMKTALNEGIIISVL